MPDKPYPDPKIFMQFDEDDPRYQVRILGLRIDALTKEKEELEKELKDEKEERRSLDKRVASMERTFQRGAGIAIALPILGTVVGFLLAYGKLIFSPWTGSK